MSLDHHVGQRMGPGPKPSEKTEIRALSLLQIHPGEVPQYLYRIRKVPN